MDLHFVPVELVELLKHADVEGKKFTWIYRLMTTQSQAPLNQEGSTQNPNKGK